MTEVMSENVSLNSDLETLSDKNNAGEIVSGKDDQFKSNYTIQMVQSSTSREAEASELNTEEGVSGCTGQKNEVACENDSGDTHFESRPPSLSLNSDSTVNSYVMDEGKLEANSPAAIASYKPDTVAESIDDQQNELLATEENPFLQSVKYLEKHQILILFQSFAAQIVYKRPDNPLQYLVDVLERAREEEQQEQQVQTGKRDSS